MKAWLIMDAWFLVGGGIWRDLGSSFAEESVSLRAGFEVSEATCIPSWLSLIFFFGSRCEFSCAVPAACCLHSPIIMDLSPLEP